MPMPIAHSHPGRDGADQCDASPHGQGRLQRHDITKMQRRGVSVESESNAHHVVMQTSLQQGSCGIGEMTAEISTLLRQLVQNLMKTSMLTRRYKRIVSLGVAIGTCQMAVEAAKLKIFKLVDRFHESGPFLPVTAQSRHAGVQFQLDRKATATSIGKVVAQQCLTHAAQGWHQLPVQAAAELFGLGEISKKQDRRLDACTAQLNPFLQRGNAKTDGTASQGSSCNGFCTMAVPIGLDDSHETAVSGKMPTEGRGIGFDGCWVDLHPGALARIYVLIDVLIQIPGRFSRVAAQLGHGICVLGVTETCQLLSLA